MQPRRTNLTLKIRRDENGFFRVKTERNSFNGYVFPVHLNSTLHEPVIISSSSEEDDDDSEDEDKQSCEDAHNQLVVYDPSANRTGEIEAVPDPINYQAPPFVRHTFPNHSPRVLPAVGAFTVQCANCFKWRLIPTKEKYEQIREHILERHFICETAREWRPEVSCDHPADISQDGSKLWAIDKPNIAQPPPGWQRLLRIRGEGSTKFADVYYVAPSGKTLRSMVEIQRFLLEHPEYMAEGVNMSQFSFQIPKPLQENYVRKRPRLTAPYDGTGLQMQMQMQKPLEPCEVNPIAWAGPNEITDLQLGGPGIPTPCFEAPAFEPVIRPANKKARTKAMTKPSKQICRTNLDNQRKAEVKEPHQASYDTSRSCRGCRRWRFKRSGGNSYEPTGLK